MQFQVSDMNCPKCHNPVSLATIEPHPTSTDLVHHNYECVNCGPVITKVISLREDAEKSVQAPRRLFR